MDPLQIEQENAVKHLDEEDHAMNSTQDIIINGLLRKSDCLVDDIKMLSNLANVVEKLNHWTLKTLGLMYIYKTKVVS